MAQQKRGDDAQDHAPAPETPPSRPGSSKPAAQDGANYEPERKDADALQREDLNSANDE